MPKQRKGSSSLGRKTKVAKNSQDRRKQESPGSRERRLHQNRTSTSSARQQESPDTQDRRLCRNREAMVAARQRESPETSDRRLCRDREAKAAARQQESPTTHDRRLCRDREAKADARQQESPTSRGSRLCSDREATADARQRESPGRQEHRRDQDRIQTAILREQQRRQLGPNYYKARTTENILSGDQSVAYSCVGPLINEDGTASPMATMCPMCRAIKWKNEAKGMCCKNGKVAPPTFPDYPDRLKQLWEGNHPYSASFIKYTRQLNNSLAMACLKVDRPPRPPGHHGWQPTVTIQGKVSILMGGLQPDEGQEPKFAQLYVMDPDHAQKENEVRLATVTLPKSATAHDKQVLLNLIDILRQELNNWNPYVHDFKMACQILSQENPQQLNLVLDERKRPFGEHSRRYNLGLKEISVLMSDEPVKRRSFSVLLRDGGIREMFDTHRSADPLHFVLLFPTGADGWHLDLKQEGSGKNLSPLQYYCFQIQHRLNNPNILLRGYKLFQEYLCVMYAKVENQRLIYIQQNQQTLRSEKYRRICEDVTTANNADDIRSGRKVILPPSFTGSPRYLHQHFQNAVAIAREYHKPDLFITFTCNPQWPEITQSLFPNQQPQDRPDIVARVFNLKRKELMNDLINGKVMGRRTGNVDVVEFQKRGLPHSHILFILEEEDRLHTAQEVDQIITAELPPDPNTFPEGPQKEQARLLEQLVVTNMVHNCTEVCKQQGSQCQKGFPKDYSEVTHWDDNAFYPVYRRRSLRERGRVVAV